ncbi:type II toxin-antitoxin system CcdA family antitoxin [Pectobacterium sp. CHL-2024]
MKRRISIAADKDDYQVLSAAGVNISELVNDVIGKEVRRIKA